MHAWLLQKLSVGLPVLALVLARPALAAEKISLASCRAPGAIDRVELAVEVAGDLKVTGDPSTKKEGAASVQKLKMSVLANLNYDERTLNTAGKEGATALLAVRHYDKAAAAIEVDGQRFTPSLRADRQIVGAQVDKADVLLFSPLGPLTREELDLIDVQGNSLAVELLLPRDAVAIGERWTATNEAVAAILRPDALAKHTIQCKLASADAQNALVELEGAAEAAMAGVSSKMEVKGKLLFDRARQRVTWFGLLIDEDRDIGHVAPGVKVVGRFQMKITPGVQSPHLTDQALAGFALEPSDAGSLLAYRSSAGGWEFVNDRRWYVTSDEDDQAVLRLVDRGELIAQCNIATMAQVPVEKLPTLDDFQKDIRAGLGEHFGSFVEAGQRSNEAEYREFRVVAEGKASELPMRWIYYYLADASGRQVVLAFVVQSELAERLAEADRQLVAGVRLNESQLAATAQPAAR